MAKISGYELSRNFFDWCFENPEMVSTNHIAIYFFAIEHCNRLGWKEKFGYPTQMVMDAIGIKKHQTYIKYFDELCEWGFFKLVQKSKNQYSANIISLTSAMPKTGKALDKAFINHSAKQTQSNGQSNGSIDKQDNKEQDKPVTIEFDVFWKIYPRREAKKKAKDKWEKLTLEQQQKIIDTLPKFLEGKDVQFVPMPVTYFNNERWDDEITVSTQDKPPVVEAKRLTLQEAQDLKNSFG